MGRPRGLKVIGDRVLFIRSSSGIDPAGSLWQLDLTTQPPTEVCLVDAATLLTTGDLPAAERARRERMREVTSGITHFTATKSGTALAFAISGIPYVSVLDPAIRTRELAAPGSVTDPRVSPDGQHVAYVVDGSLWIIDAHDLDAQPQLLCESTSDTETWGLADFIAAEELERLRGYWWLPDGSGLIVERSDDSPVEVRWISDPAKPTSEPVAHRYPAAGEPNPIVELWLVALDGTRTQLTWDLVKFPYLATVAVNEVGSVVSVLSRDQRTVSINQVDLKAGAMTERAVRTDPAWIDIHGELPYLDTDGALIEIIVDAESDTNRITRDGVYISPSGLQINAIVDSSAGGVLAVASPDPMEQHLYRITNDGVTIAKEIELEDPIENIGAQLVKEVASKTADEAGDGTTTATVLAQEIYALGSKNVAAGANPMELKRGIETGVEMVVEELRKISKKVSTNKEIEQVATVSANNDSEIGAMIADAMDKIGKDGIITVEEVCLGY